jgi:hypothetical protein
VVEATIDLRGHDLVNPEFIHSNYQSVWCSCTANAAPQFSLELHEHAAPVKSFDGRICANCGGSNFLRTGSCLTCADCGSSDGCG